MSRFGGLSQPVLKIAQEQELTLSRSFSEPTFLSTFGKNFPQQVARSASLSKLQPDSGSALLGPQFDASFLGHTACASLGPRRDKFRNTQKYWDKSPGRPHRVVKPPYILGRKLQQRAPVLPSLNPEIFEGCSVGCYSGIREWGTGGEAKCDTSSPTGGSYVACFGKSPTGRGGDPRRLSKRDRSVSLPRIAPGF
eukprot:TRINITY_DN81086_c0_g1_i1.p1 TRINITY_DN81086_c0_g1~~TRINITY_DN81086_c0_g1_i1.p1  ORF type:complete len:195 (-),score=22.52 TRINITY_DN81086_c0_g1_i1:78-662(-)